MTGQQTNGLTGKQLDFFGIEVERRRGAGSLAQQLGDVELRSPRSDAAHEPLDCTGWQVARIL